MPYVTRAQCTAETSQVMGVSLAALMNDDGTPLAATAAAGKFGRVVGGWGTGGVVLEGEAASGNSKTSTAHFMWFVPQNYEAGTNISFKVKARTSVVLATSSGLDLQAYKSDENGGVGSDLCATASQDINSATWAEYTFTVTGTTINPGDKIEFYLQCVANDATGSNSGKSQIGNIDIVSTTRM